MIGCIVSDIGNYWLFLDNYWHQDVINYVTDSVWTNLQGVINSTFVITTRNIIPSRSNSYIWMSNVQYQTNFTLSWIFANVNVNVQYPTNFMVPLYSVIISWLVLLRNDDLSAEFSINVIDVFWPSGSNDQIKYFSLKYKDWGTNLYLSFVLRF